MEMGMGCEEERGEDEERKWQGNNGVT